jgi:hypothetical protein
MVACSSKLLRCSMSDMYLACVCSWVRPSTWDRKTPTTVNRQEHLCPLHTHFCC